MQKKGLLRLSLQDVQFTNKINHNFVIKICLGESSFIKQFAGNAKINPNDVVSLNNYTTYFPVEDRLEIQIYEKQSSEFEGYFNLPMKKLYDYPFKNHLISICCVTRDRSQLQIEKEQFCKINITAHYLEHKTAHLEVYVEKAVFEQQNESHLKKDLFVECKIGDVCSQTTVKGEASKAFTWIQILPFTLEDIPSKIELIVKDKDMVKDSILGLALINPQQDQLLSISSQEERVLELKFGGQRVGKLFVKFSFKLNE